MYFFLKVAENVYQIANGGIFLFFRNRDEEKETLAAAVKSSKPSSAALAQIFYCFDIGDSILQAFD